MFLAIAALIPDTYVKRLGVAIFKSTPTLLTESSTTPCNDSSSTSRFLCAGPV